MTDLAETPETLSTTLDTETRTDVSGGGQPRTLGEPEQKPEGKMSLRDVLSDEVKKADKEQSPAKKDDADKGDDKAEDKAEAKDRKPEAESSEKAEDKPEPLKEADTKSGDEAKPEPKATEGHPKPPKSFLPDAREKWTNVPRPVQRDVENMAKVHEQEVSRYREASERYEAVRHYDEVARKHGGNLETTLQRVAQLEDMMAKNPVAALNNILLQAGPRKPDGQPYSLFEVASAIVQKGQQGYQQMVAQPPQQQNNNSEVEQLKQQLQQVQAQQAQAQIEAQVIAPFRAANPRYDELQDDIALFLKSGKIPASLSLQEKLEAAYDMADRLNRASHDKATQQESGLDDLSRVDPPADSSGTKSIKSAPGAVSRDMEPERGGSIRDVLRSEMKRARRA